MSSLTDKEKALVIRRARGEYAVDDNLKKIRAARKTNRNPDDALYLDFLDVALSERGDKKEYTRLQQEILARHPNPNLWQLRPQGASDEEATGEPVRQRKRRVQANGTATKFKFEDLPRLPSGWDPQSGDVASLDQNSGTAGRD